MSKPIVVAAKFQQPMEAQAEIREEAFEFLPHTTLGEILAIFDRENCVDIRIIPSAKENA